MESIAKKIGYKQTGPKYHHYQFLEEDKEEFSGTFYISKEVLPPPAPKHITIIILLEES